MAELFMQYKRANVEGLSFRKYLQTIGFTNPAIAHHAMDNGRMFGASRAGPELIAIPQQPIIGDLQVIVLLVDFEDREGNLSRAHYEDMLFSQDSYPTGSMRDYYREVSLDRVDVTGTVHGWLRLPEKYSYYTNQESGTSWDSYPRNAPRMAEDAVRAAIEHGVEFPPALDKLGQGTLTALFIVHAGIGAERILNPVQRRKEIWSHKWVLRNPVAVTENLAATVYLTVPHDCRVGVYAHELGHLAFQWQDFYDPNYDEDGNEWDGAGRWDLMAGGSYNGNGNIPAHPAGLHKLQHGWVEMEEVTGTRDIQLRPFTPTSGQVVRVVSPRYKPGQYLVLENRARQGFDFDLPGEGLLVWRVDESKEQFAPQEPGMLLIQADGRHDLEKPNDWNQGDAGDPFPGSTSRTELGDTGGISTSFPGEQRSGISLRNIVRDSTSGTISLTVDLTDSDGVEVLAEGSAHRSDAGPHGKAGSKRKTKKETA